MTFFNEIILNNLFIFLKFLKFVYFYNFDKKIARVN